MANNQARHRPNTEQSSAPARGIPRSQSAEAWKPAPDNRQRFSDRQADEIAWVQLHLPEEHLGYATTAMGMLRLADIPVTTKSVVARLESQGRSMAQMKAKGWA